MKKILSFLMVLVMVFGTFAMTVTAAEATTSSPLIMFDHHDVSAGGNAGYSASNIKTEIPYDAIPFSKLGMNAPVKGESYVIKTADELVLFSQNVNAKNDYRGVTVYLGADIDMSGKTMDPIGNSTAAFGSTLSAPYFKGVFDGQGYEIQNLKMSSSGINVGLFGAIGGAAIINLVIDSTCSFTYTGSDPNARVGSVVAFAHSVNDDGNLAGAYSLGRTTEGTSISWLVENVKNEATVNGGAGVAGGIVGCVSAQTNWTPYLNRCTNQGIVRGATASGLIGKNSGRPLYLHNSVVYLVGGNVLTNTYCSGGTVANCNTVSVEDLSAIANINTLKTDSGFNADLYASGTEWKITDAAGLKLVSVISNAGSYDFYGKTLYLANDINMRGVTDFEPIGNYLNANLAEANTPGVARVFRGTFDGNGYAIENLTMVSESNGNANVALFGVIRGAHIKNLTVADSCSFLYLGTSATAKTAGLAAVGFAHGEDMHLGTWTDGGDDYIPYIIENVTNNATVIANAGYAGGILGVTYGRTDRIPSVKSCVNNGSVAGAIGAAGIVGGLISRKINISHCVNNGRITAQDVHGICYIVYGQLLGEANMASGAELQSFSYYGFSEKIPTYPTTLGYSKSRVKAVDLSDVPEITALTGGTNTTATAYKISTADALVAFSSYVNAGNPMKGITVYLAADIDMAGKTTYPIGTTSNSIFCSDLNTAPYFGGTFDGQGYTIKNLNLSFAKMSMNATAVVGLFGITRGAVIRNTVLDQSCTVAHTQRAVRGSYVGGIVAVASTGESGSCTVVENCYSAATVTSSEGNASGIVCYLLTASDTDRYQVVNCTSNGTVSAPTLVAGIVATTNNAGFAVTNCRNLGMVVNTSESAANSIAAAGIFANPDSKTPSVIEECVNEGKIVSITNLSGIVGIDSRVSVSVTRCTNYGTLSLTLDGGRMGAIYGWHKSGTFGHFQENADATASIDQPGTRVDYVGSQSMITGDSYSVRFLSTIDTLTPDAIGYELNVYYANGSKMLQISDLSRVETTTVYKSVLATVNGQQVVEYAENYDGLYLMALTVTGIPNACGDVTFSITPYSTVNGETVYMETLEVTYNAGTFVSKKTQSELWKDENGYKPYTEAEQIAKDTNNESANGTAFLESFNGSTHADWTHGIDGTWNDSETVDYRDGMMYFRADQFDGNTAKPSAIGKYYAADGAASECYVAEIRARVEYFGVTTVFSVNCNGRRTAVYLYESKLILNLGREGDHLAETVYVDVGYDWHTYRIEMNDHVGRFYVDGEYKTSFIPEVCGSDNRVIFFMQPLNKTNVGELYVDYISYEPKSNSTLKITSPTAGQTVRTGTGDVTVTCSGASSGVRYYLNGSDAGTGGSSITFKGLKPGVYSVRAETDSQISAERVFLVGSSGSIVQSTAQSSASLLQSSYILRYTVTGTVGKVNAGDGVYPLDLSYTSNTMSYVADNGTHKVAAGLGDYTVVVDSGVATVYYNGRLLVSYRMPYAACETVARISGTVTGLSVSANNGTYYKTELNGTDSFSTSLNSITYEYAVEFEYEKGSQASVELKDGAYLLHLLFEQDGNVNALVSPQFNTYRDAICTALDGKNLYRVQVSSGIAQIFVNNVWLASWRMPETIADCTASVSGKGVDLFRIVETEDVYFFSGTPNDADWSKYFSMNDASNTQTDINGLQNLKVYSRDTVLEATLTVGSSTSGAFYLDAKFYGGSELISYPHSGIFAGYDFSSKSFKWGSSMDSLSVVKSQTLAAGTHTLKLVVEGMTASLYCDGTLVATKTTELNGWGNAGYIHTASGVTLNKFFYQGDGKPLCDTSSYLYSTSLGLSHTIAMAQIGEKVYMFGESSDVMESTDGGRSFNKVTMSGNFGYNTIVLQSGKVLSLKRNHNANYGGYMYLAYVSSDNGASFEGPYTVTSPRNPYRFTMNGKVMQASNGRILFVSGETEDENVGRLWIYYSDDEGVTWTRAKSEFSQKNTGTNLQEGMIVELDNGVLRMYARNDQGFLVYSDSYDNGVTWEMDMKNSNFASVVSAFNVTKDYENNAIYMAWEYNNTNDCATIQFPRTRLGLAVSYDDGKTWYYVGDFDEANDYNFKYFGHWNIGVWVTEDSVFLSAGKQGFTDKWHNYTVRISKDSIQPLARFTGLHVLGYDPRMDTEGQKLYANSVLAISKENNEVYASGDTYTVKRMDGMQTMISVQMIASFLNGTVTVNGSTATVTLGNASYVFTANSVTVNAAGTSKTMKYAAILEDGTVKITLQDLCELLELHARRIESGAILVTGTDDYLKAENILSLVGIW